MKILSLIACASIVACTAQAPPTAGSVPPPSDAREPPVKLGTKDHKLFELQHGGDVWCEGHMLGVSPAGQCLERAVEAMKKEADEYQKAHPAPVPTK